MDIERPVELKIQPLSYHKERLIYAKQFSVGYEPEGEDVLRNLDFELKRGERVFLHGANGCGKKSAKTVKRLKNWKTVGII